MSAAWTAQETRQRQLTRALAMRESGMTVAATAAMLQVNTKTLYNRLQRHANSTKKHVLLPQSLDEIDSAMRVRILSMIARGWSRKNCAAQCRVDIAVVDAVMCLPRAPSQPVLSEDVWTPVRKIACERRMRLRWNLDHIAEDLNWMPGAALHVRDVIAFIQSQKIGSHA